MIFGRDQVLSKFLVLSWCSSKACKNASKNGQRQTRLPYEQISQPKLSEKNKQLSLHSYVYVLFIEVLNKGEIIQG